MKNGFCRFCNGQRRVNSKKQCEGCGMPVANAMLPESNRTKVKKPMCPRCRSSHSTEREKGRYNCETCGGVFEAADMGYVDDRPEQNAIKKEHRR